MKYKQVHCEQCYGTHWMEHAKWCGACASPRVVVIDESDKLPIAITKQELFQRMSDGDPLRWIPHPLDATKHYGRQLFLGRDMLGEDAGLDVVGEVLRAGLLRELPESDDGVLEYEYVSGPPS